MANDMERLIRLAYKEWKLAQPDLPGPHPDEEEIVCFLEGKLLEKGNERIREHLINCVRCCEIIAIQVKIRLSETEEPTEELLSWAQNLAVPEDASSVLDIFLRFKEKLLEIVNTNGDILLGQELVPAPVLRSRQIKDFKEEVTILKDFKIARVEVRIENKGTSAFDLHIITKEKQANKIIRGLRVTLIKDGLELESYLTDSGAVVFEHVLLGRYTVEVAAIENKLATIIVDIKI